MKITDQSKLLTLADASKHVPLHDGKRVNPSTIWRWCRIGIKSRSSDRVRLGHVRVGGRVYTSEEALGAFFHAVAEADLEYFQRQPVALPKRPTNKQRQRSIKRANDTLAKAGII